MPSIVDSQSEFFRNLDTETVGDRGQAIAPAINGNVCVYAAALLPAGVYEITVIARYGAVADVIDGMVLRIGGAYYMTLPVEPVVNGRGYMITVRKKLNGAQTISVTAAQAGAVGSVYIANIIATKISDL